MYPGKKKRVMMMMDERRVGSDDSRSLSLFLLQDERKVGLSLGVVRLRSLGPSMMLARSARAMQF